jgi:hypothetical protein
MRLKALEAQGCGSMATTEFIATFEHQLLLLVASLHLRPAARSYQPRGLESGNS